MHVMLSLAKRHLSNKDRIVWQKGVPIRGKYCISKIKTSFEQSRDVHNSEISVYFDSLQYLISRFLCILTLYSIWFLSFCFSFPVHEGSMCQRKCSVVWHPAPIWSAVRNWKSSSRRDCSGTPNWRRSSAPPRRRSRFSKGGCGSMRYGLGILNVQVLFR